MVQQLREGLHGHQEQGPLLPALRSKLQTGLFYVAQQAQVWRPATRPDFSCVHLCSYPNIVFYEFRTPPRTLHSSRMHLAFYISNSHRAHLVFTSRIHIVRILYSSRIHIVRFT